MQLDRGESVGLATRVDGGPVVTRDRYADDVVKLDRPYETLDTSEIRRLAELVGLDMEGPSDA